MFCSAKVLLEPTNDHGPALPTLVAGALSGPARALGVPSAPPLALLEVVHVCFVEI
jgi:hypothetical protein